MTDTACRRPRPRRSARACETRPGSRWGGLALGCLLALGSAGAGAAGEGSAGAPETSASRLERVRNALIDEAMESPVRVSSSAWLDESGQYRHVTRLYSDLRRRALTELGAEGKPVAAAATGSPAASAPASAAASPPLADQCPRRPDGIRRDAWVTISARAHDGGHGHAVLLRVGQLAREELEARALESGGFRLVSIEAFPRNSYEYRVASNGLFDTPHLIEVSLSSSGAADFSLRPGQATSARTVTATLSLVERVGDRPLLKRAYVIQLPGAVPTVGQAPLPPAVITSIREMASDWWQAAQETGACAPLRVQVSPEAPGLLSIPVGAGSGIRLGDRWVVGDTARIPARVLERGSLEGLRLAEVVSVAPHRSMLKLESPKAPPDRSAESERGVSWFASPL